ncbi:MAG TPA: sugar phosphate isomerase/epimerase family protein [Chitinophagaceae bacterium]|nr:sugar phosphate isomerase/epimerase family protein [Chitinophagaceae bacterium]
MLSRRDFIQSSLAPLLVAPHLDIFRKKGFKIGACDWSLGKSADPTALMVAKQIGLSGVMVNMGSVKDDLHLRKTEVQDEYIRLSKETGVAISSLAIGQLNDVPYKSDPRTEQWVWDSIDVAKRFRVPVILLAFFVKNDLRNDEAGIKETISRLKKVAPKAEKEGVILGLETYLDAAGHKRIIDAVGSPNIKVYYDFRNTADAGHDPIDEFRKLGKDLVCELHMKENQFLLSKGSLDWQGISNMIEEIGYRGDHWMQIEWSLPDKADLVSSYIQNKEFLRGHFATSTK